MTTHGPVVAVPSLRRDHRQFMDRPSSQYRIAEFEFFDWELPVLTENTITDREELYADYLLVCK